MERSKSPIKEGFEEGYSDGLKKNFSPYFQYFSSDKRRGYETGYFLGSTEKRQWDKIISKPK